MSQESKKRSQVILATVTELILFPEFFQKDVICIPSGSKHKNFSIWWHFSVDKEIFSKLWNTKEKCNSNIRNIIPIAYKFEFQFNRGFHSCMSDSVILMPVQIRYLKDMWLYSYDQDSHLQIQSLYTWTFTGICLTGSAEGGQEDCFPKVYIPRLSLGSENIFLLLYQWDLPQCYLLISPCRRS